MIAFTLTKFAYKAIPQDGAVMINTATYFYPCSSWLNKANIKNSAIHEQLHFDIAEYHKRLFLKRLSETRSSEDMFAASTRAIFRDISDQRRIMNSDYDKETNYGQDEEQQIKWNGKVTNLLASLENYSTNTITINLK